ncbi:MAG: restriction endonuclease [Thermoleophilaceae bacterium]|nr:restriction endonuclease [Thermoleophilaceae bacterium]
MVDGLDFDGWDETDFEEFCFQLLDGLDDFSNVDWRKGTPKQASPADRGRDLVAQVERVDVDRSKHVETWFADCKHYAKGIPPEALQGLLAWANAERPDVALVIASGFLSNAAKDYISNYVENNRPPFRIKYWERPVLDKLTRGNRELLDRFVLGGMRSQSEIIAAEEEFFDRIWYERHLVGRMKHESGEGRTTDEIHAVALEAAERVKGRRPDLHPTEDDFEWGMWNGKLSALRWVLGDDWDFLDT